MSRGLNSEARVLLGRRRLRCPAACEAQLAPRIVLQVNPQVRGAASPRRPVAAAADALERELLANEPRECPARCAREERPSRDEPVTGRANVFAEGAHRAEVVLRAPPGQHRRVSCLVGLATFQEDKHDLCDDGIALEPGVTLRRVDPPSEAYAISAQGTSLAWFAIGSNLFWSQKEEPGYDDRRGQLESVGG